MTLNDLVKTHKIFNEATRKIGMAGGGTFEMAARLGLASAIVKDSVSKEFTADKADKIASLFENRVQLFYYDRDRINGGPHRDSANTKPIQHYYSEFNSELDDPNSFKADIYKKFSNIDMSGNYGKEFDEAAQWYSDKMRGWYDLTGYNNQIINQNMQRIESLMSEIKHTFA